VRRLGDATIEELLEAVFSMPSVTQAGHSTVWLVARHSPASKGVNTEAEEAVALEAVTRQQPVKIQQTEKAWCVL
jgi:hypothetical protein